MVNSFRSTVQSNLKILCFFLLTAYTAYAVGTNVGKYIFVHPDSWTLVPRVLNFPDSLWNPYVQSGHFAILEPQYQHFYPLAYFLRFKANPLTFNVFFLLNFALTGFCLFLYLREIGLNIYACILGGMTFMLSGFVAGHKMHSTLVSAGAWIPLTLTFLERSFKSESQRLLQLTYGAIAFSFVILAGYPAMVVYGGIVVGGYAFFRILFETPPKQEKSKNLHEFLLFCKSLSLIFIPGFLLGAVAVVPTLNSLPLLTRRQISFEYFSLPAWNFEAFPMILFRFFYGATYPAALYPSPYSGPASLWEVSSFIGVLPLAFFLLVFWIRNEVTEGRVWIAQFLVAMCLVAGGRAPFYEFFSRKFPIITAGKNMLLVWFETSNLFMLTGILLAVISACVLVAWLKGHPRHQFAFGIAVTLFVVSIGSLLLYRVLYHIPILNLFGVPARHLFEVNLAMSILGAIGLNYLIQNQPTPKTLGLLRKISIVISALGVSFLTYYYLVVLPGMRKTTPGFPILGLHLLIPMTAIAISIILLRILPRFRLRRYFLSAVLVFVFMDLFSFARFHYNLPASLDPEWDCLKIRSLEKDYSTFRVSLANTPGGMCKLFGIHGNNPIWFEHYVKFTRFNCCPSALRDNKDLLHTNLLSLLSVKYVSYKKDFLNENLRPADFELIGEHDDDALYLNKRFLPRIRSVRALQTVNDLGELNSVIYEERFDPGRIALVLGGRSIVLADSQILESHFENDLIRIRLNNSGTEGFLVFSDSWHPGWRVYVDRTPASLIKVYGFQMGANIFGPGEHLVEFKFEPSSYLLGKWISLVTLGLMLCFIFYRKSRGA